MKIIKFNDLRIRKTSKKIFFFEKKKILFLIKNMIKIMYLKNGIGISSSQINYDYKIFVIDITNKKNKPLIFINAKLLNFSKYYTLSNEGCLSIEKIFISIPRPDKICLKFINIYNKIKIKTFSGIISRCIQHEIDHLFGKLILDYFNLIIKKK